MKTIILSLTLMCCSICNGQKIDSEGIRPVSLAGLDQAITLKTKVAKLEGNGIDADGAIVSYMWTQVYGDVVSISNPTLAKTTVKGFKEWGIYIFKLTVTDNMGNTDSDNVTITAYKF